MKKMATHRQIEERSIRLHRAIAGRLRAEPALLGKARQNLARYRERYSARGWVGEWQTILDRPLEEVLAFIVSDTDKARELRQSTPFAGILSPRERWRVYKDHDARRA